MQEHIKLRKLLVLVLVKLISNFSLNFSDLLLGQQNKFNTQMYNSDHTDSTILQILEDQKESRQEIKEEVNSEDDDDVKKDLKSNITNVKLVDHQGDRYANKMIGKGLFDTSEENIYASKKPSPYGLYLNAPTLTKTSDSTKQGQITDQNIPSSAIRMGSKTKLPSLKNLQRAASIGLSSEEELARISKNKKQIIPSPQLLRRKTNFKWSQISDFASFIKDPIPRSKKLVASLRRNRDGLKRFFPLFELYFANDEKYIMSSKRMSCNSTSTFYINSSLEELFDSGNSFLAVVQSNFLGTVYNVYSTQSGSEKEILATIIYENQVTFSSKPRQIQVYVLSPYYTYAQLSGIDDKKNLKDLYEIQQNSLNKKIIKLVNKKPKWNEKKKSFQMDFHGKMKMSSVKNMILVEAENEQREVLLIAKTDDHEFAMDVDSPLSPRVALAIANSSFDFKWVCQ